jgi:hypothetical protein
MAKAKEPFDNLTKPAEQAIETAQEAMQNYFSWLQKTMSASPWSNMEVNRKLSSYAAQNVSACFKFVHKVTQAKNLQDVIQIQTEFMQSQWNAFAEQAKSFSHEYTKAETKKTTKRS